MGKKRDPLEVGQEKARGLDADHYLAHHKKMLEMSNYIQRARSVTAGPAGGGLVEIAMRTDHVMAYQLFNPGEILELIRSLSALVGVDPGEMQPRGGFEQWRGWRLEDRRPGSEAYAGGIGKKIEASDRQKASMGLSPEDRVLAPPETNGTGIHHQMSGIPELNGGPKVPRAPVEDSGEPAVGHTAPAHKAE